MSLTLGFSSCDNFLDELPDNRMELKNGKDITDLLVSAYPQVYPAYLLELYSDNSDHYNVTGWNDGSQFDREAYAWKDITDVSETESPQEIWQGMYKAIAAANQSLKAIDDLGGGSDLNAQKGEALLCRAYSMFLLANVFCDAYAPTTASQKAGLPYPTQPEEHVGTTYERGTLKELYEKINADIEAGLPLLQDQYAQPKFHFTRAAGYAFAAQFNLYYCNFEKAISYADKVLGTNSASDLRDWTSFYDLTANGQTAPNAYVSTSENANILLVNYYSQWGVFYGPYNAGNEYAHGRLLAQNEDLQSRGPWGSSSAFGYTTWYNGSLSKYFVNKIPYSFETTDQQAQIGIAHCELPVLNTDKLLLVRAEAKALSGNYEGAVADLNLELKALSSGRMSTSLTAINSFYDGIVDYKPTAPTPKKPLHPVFASITDKTETNVINAILQLRRIITLGEGERLQDVKRYGIVIYRRTLDRGNNVLSVTDSLTVDDPRRAIQIPQDVISAGLKPNIRSAASQPQPVMYKPEDNSGEQTLSK